MTILELTSFTIIYFISEKFSWGLDGTLCLTEDDIPGAILKEPFEKHTVKELQWWLLCHGITLPSSAKKADVIERWV